VHIQQIDQEIVKTFLQDVSIHLTVEERSSQNHVDVDLITIPSIIPNKMVIAVKPTKISTDKYWLAQVVDKKDDDPLTYNLHYYTYSKQKKGWVLMKGNNAWGTTPHSAVIYAGIEFNQNQTMKAHCIRHLQHLTK
jgi:hypothetical protein